jgi:hypothetical protein
VKARTGSPPPRRFRRVLLVACALLVAGAAGCSGGDAKREKRADPLKGALSYLPADSGAAFVVATDSRTGLGGLGSAVKGWRSLERRVRSSVGLAGIDFDRLRSQLDNPFVLAVAKDGSRVGAIRVRDPGALRREAERRIGHGNAERLDEHDGALAWRDRGLRPQAFAYSAAVDRDLVVAQSEEALRKALDAAGGRNFLSDGQLVAALGRLAPGSTVRIVGDAQRLLSSGDPGQAADARRVPWIRALGLFAGALEARRSAIVLDLRIRTDRAKLGEGDLPIEPGARPPLLHDPGAAAAVAVHRPARLFRFIEKVLQATDPGTFARLQAGEDQMRSVFGVDIRKDLLEKITNLSLAARSSRSVTFEGRLVPGAQSAFTRALDRAQPFVQGVTGDLLLSSGTVEARGAGAQRVWLVRSRSSTIARYAVRDGTLIGTIGAGDLPAAVRGRRLAGASGALVVKGDPAPIAPLVRFLPGIPKELVDIVPKLPNVTLGVRADTEALTLRALAPISSR